MIKIMQNKDNITIIKNNDNFLQLLEFWSGSKGSKQIQQIVVTIIPEEMSEDFGPDDVMEVIKLKDADNNLVTVERVFNSQPTNNSMEVEVIEFEDFGPDDVMEVIKLKDANNNLVTVERVFNSQPTNDAMEVEVIICSELIDNNHKAIQILTAKDTQQEPLAGEAMEMIIYTTEESMEVDQLGEALVQEVTG